MLYEVITAKTFQEISDMSKFVFDEKGRITSYNVCYTKLLRIPPFEVVCYQGKQRKDKDYDYPFFHKNRS